MQTIDRKILIVAAVALIDVDGRILISKRPDNKYLGGLWEFPGGKLENHENLHEILINRSFDACILNLNNFSKY